MFTSRSIAVGVASCLFVASAFLVVDRGGLLAWGGGVLGALLLLKVLRRPSSRDVVLTVAVLGLWTLSWVATWSYVKATWESGEVVQLVIDDRHTARVWVLDMSDGPTMYYDAPPDIASRLLAGASVSMTRNGRVRHECASASLVRDLPDERVQDVIHEMEEKYSGGNTATAVFYSVLGGKRDRVPLLIHLTPCGRDQPARRLVDQDPSAPTHVESKRGREAT